MLCFLGRHSANEIHSIPLDETNDDNLRKHEKLIFRVEIVSNG